MRIETGRMHQIRATLEYLGVNIINDSLYATKKGKGGVPEEIELKSILISFLKQNEERVTYNLLKNEKKEIIKGHEKIRPKKDEMGKNISFVSSLSYNSLFALFLNYYFLY